MSAITAMVRTNMAAMAHVFLAHRVRSIHIEKATNFLENICAEQTEMVYQAVPSVSSQIFFHSYLDL